MKTTKLVNRNSQASLLIAISNQHLISSTCWLLVPFPNFFFFFVNRRSNIDSGNTQSAPLFSTILRTFSRFR